MVGTISTIAMANLAMVRTIQNLDKMAAILSKTIRKLDEMAAILSTIQNLDTILNPDKVAHYKFGQCHLSKSRHVQFSDPHCT